MKHKRLLESIKEAPTTRRSVETWYDRLPESVRAELDEVKAAFRAGDLPHSIRQLRALVCEELHLTVGRDAFTDWLRKAT